MFSYSWISLYFTLFNYQFVFAALSIRERFKSLNEYLLRVIDEPANFLRPHTLDSIMRMHDQLCDAILSLNSTFAIQVNGINLIQTSKK